jgi:hypothetical protein
MISAFKHIRLSGYNLLPQSVDGQTRLTLNSSGVAYFSELSTASGILNTKIDAFSGTFQSFVNNLDTQFATDAQLTAISGALQTGINTVATNLGTTGSTLDTKIGSLSGYSNSTFSTILNLAETGSTLQSNINTVTTNLGTTGSTLDTKINSLSGNLTNTYATIANLTSTGSTLDTKINSLSGTLTSDYVQKATQQQFIVNLPINVESTGITFPVAFASTPNSVQVTFEPSTDVAYMVAVKNRTTVGFTAEFSDVLFEAGNKLNVFASV